MHLEIKKFKGRKENRITPNMVSSLWFFYNKLSILACKSGPHRMLKPGFTDVCYTTLSRVKNE